MARTEAHAKISIDFALRGKTREKFYLVASDFGVWGLGFVVGALLTFGTGGITPVGAGTLAVFVILAFATTAWFWNLGHYTRRRPFWDEVREVLHIVLLFGLVGAALFFYLRSDFSRVWFLGAWSTVVVAIPLARTAVKRLLIKKGGWQLPTVILGAGDNALATAAALQSEPLMGYEVKAFLVLPEDESPQAPAVELAGKMVPLVRLQMIDGLPEQPQWLSKANAVIALEEDDIALYDKLIKQLRRTARSVSIVPPLKGFPVYGMVARHFFRHEVLYLELQNNLGRRAPRWMKRAFDLVAASALLFLLSPVFAYLAWKVRQTGPQMFFRHERIGQNGQTFKCYKFRSMVPNAKEVLEELLASDRKARAEWERDYKLRNDPRITKIGAFLRKTSLDELPQLWNVLKGEMSLVGPRPIIEPELEKYGSDVDYYLETRPGMTGLWQVSGRNDTDYDYRVYLDSWYAKNWSLWYDIVILFKTVKVVLGKTGAY